VADKPNFKSRPDSKPSNSSTIEYVIAAIIIIILINSIAPIIGNVFKNQELTFYGFNLFKIFESFKESSQTLKFISVGISVFFFVSVFAVNYKLAAIRVAQRKLLYPETTKVKIGQSAGGSPIADKWKVVLDHISGGPNDWKLAIIEADIMLDELLDSMSYNGESIGEKLKGVEKSDFLTIDKAWEAHKIRNSIAHEGSNFVLSEREVKRVIDLYKSVFEEFHII